MSILLRGDPEAVFDCIPGLHGLRLRAAEGEELGERRWCPVLEDVSTLARSIKAVKQDRQLLFLVRGLWPAAEEAWEHIRNQLRGAYTPVGPRLQGVAVQGPNGVRWVPGGFQGNAWAGRQPQPPPRQGGGGGRSAQNGGRSGGRGGQSGGQSAGLGGADEMCLDVISRQLSAVQGLPGNPKGLREFLAGMASWMQTVERERREAWETRDLQAVHNQQVEREMGEIRAEQGQTAQAANEAVQQLREAAAAMAAAKQEAVDGERRREEREEERRVAGESERQKAAEREQRADQRRQADSDRALARMEKLMQQMSRLAHGAGQGTGQAGGGVLTVQAAPPRRPRCESTSESGSSDERDSRHSGCSRRRATRSRSRSRSRDRRGGPRGNGDAAAGNAPAVQTEDRGGAPAAEGGGTTEASTGQKTDEREARRVARAAEAAAEEEREVAATEAARVVSELESELGRLQKEYQTASGEQQAAEAAADANGASTGFDAEALEDEARQAGARAREADADIQAVTARLGPARETARLTGTAKTKRRASALPAARVTKAQRGEGDGEESSEEAEGRSA